MIYSLFWKHWLHFRFVVPVKWSLWAPTVLKAHNCRITAHMHLLASCDVFMWNMVSRFPFMVTAWKEKLVTPDSMYKLNDWRLTRRKVVRVNQLIKFLPHQWQLCVSVCVCVCSSEDRRCTVQTRQHEPKRMKHDEPTTPEHSTDSLDVPPRSCWQKYLNTETRREDGGWKLEERSVRSEFSSHADHEATAPRWELRVCFIDQC